MKYKKLSASFKETELKLALPSADPSRLLECLVKTRTLARRAAIHLDLHNIYYDSPEQRLRQSRIALRLRRVGNAGNGEGRWLQTLKIGGQGDSALSQRGEWEVAVTGPQLSYQALQDTPWTEFDPHGYVFRSLKPCFTTRFARTSWVLSRRDGTRIEVSLDLGNIVNGRESTPICELELELLAGQPDALFAVALDLSRTLAVLPLNASKSERGYRLGQDETPHATYAKPPWLNAEMDISAAAQRVLREMFGQFTANLYRLLLSSEPEAVHQARIGWRRFKSSLRLFKPALNPQGRPSWQDLQDLLLRLGALRNIDVARLDTLPALADVYKEGDKLRQQHWQTMVKTLEHASQLQLVAVRDALRLPAVGTCLLLIAQWLESLSGTNQADQTVIHLSESLARFAKRRTGRLHLQLQHICQLEGQENAHQVRLLAKRLRYNIESLRTLLPKKIRLAEREQAMQLQDRIGVQRDVAQALQLISQLDAAVDIQAFMRGYSLGYSHGFSATVTTVKRQRPGRRDS